MNKTIIIPAYNRPQYLGQCLSYLIKCWGVSEYTVLASIDMSKEQTRCVQLFEKYRAAFKNLVVYCWSENYNGKGSLGCNEAVHRALQWAARESSSFIYLEDDILLAPSALRFFEFADDKYRNDDNIFAVCAYGKEKVGPENYWTVYKRDSYQPWGNLMWSDKLEPAFQKWSKLYNPPVKVNRMKDGQPVQEIYNYVSWDYVCKHEFRDGKMCIYPRLGQARNIGSVGAHTPSPQWHANKHTPELWAGELNLKEEECNFHEILHLEQH